MSNTDILAQKSAHALRFLAMDAVQAAKSGHPGMPMGMADLATVLWSQFLKHNPANPGWFNRDRFILSNGHGSMLLYGLLHLSGYDLSMEELRNFRQFGSKTPGHPEVGHTPGVEVTTGPLGQGISNAVGMALAERQLAARFNRPGHAVIDHHTYVFIGDGCLQEGISHEACSLAGHQKLGRLIVLYDDNGITIDGETNLSFSEDVPARFAAYGWHTQQVDGHDMQAVAEALKAAQAQGDAPSLIACRTVIGQGSPNKGGSHTVHGAPLGDEEIAATRAALGWESPPFEMPADVTEFWGRSRATGSEAEAAWNQAVAAYQQAFPAEGAELARIIAGQPSEGWRAPLQALLDEWLANPPAGDATRSASGKALAAFAPAHPDIIGGSADLTPSNNTWVASFTDISHENPGGTYMRYGVREHGMAAVMNGLSLHGGVVPYAGTFLTFADYMRPSLRLAAICNVHVVHVFTHDSIGVGEDGPTHQPVEHYAALRSIPNMRVFRPGDPRETLEAWEAALSHTEGPSALLLTRQSIPTLPGTGKGGLAKGGYVLADSPEGLELKVLLLATGSELHLAMEAQAQLADDGVGARVVSLPCWELFEAQTQAYRDSVLPPAITARVGVEAGVAQGWGAYLGLGGAFVGMTGFGASAPASKLFAHFGLTVDAVVAAARRVLK